MMHLASDLSKWYINALFVEDYMFPLNLCFAFALVSWVTMFCPSCQALISERVKDNLPLMNTCCESWYSFIRKQIILRECKCCCSLSSAAKGVWLFLTAKPVSSDTHPLPYLSFSPQNSVYHCFPSPDSPTRFLTYIFLCAFLSWLLALASIITVSLPLNSSPLHADAPGVFSGPIRNASICSSPNTVCTSLCKYW